MNTDRALLLVLLIEVAIASILNINLIQQVNHLNQTGDQLTTALQKVGLA